MICSSMGEDERLRHLLEEIDGAAADPRRAVLEALAADLGLTPGRLDVEFDAAGHLRRGYLTRGPLGARDLEEFQG